MRALIPFLVCLAIAACGGSAATPTPDIGVAGDSAVSPSSDSGTPGNEQFTFGSSYTWSPHIPSSGDLVFVDRETGSTFNLRGEAIAGPLAQEKRLLRPLVGYNMFWFAWSVFYAGSEIWNRTDKVAPGNLPADKTGIRGCGAGKDCIPSLPNTGVPQGPLDMVAATAPGAAYLLDSDLVLGVFLEGQARAYPHNILWWHEIANDEINGKRFSVTFCPLTGSGLAFDGKEHSFGVSGQLFNSNLVMYDHQTDTLWPQLYFGPATGPNANSNSTWLLQLPLQEMTWGAWKKLHPNTTVLSDNTGFSRNYQSYPYGDYRTNHNDTFGITNPSPDPKYPNKAMTFGLVDKQTGLARAYVHSDMAAIGARAVINDTVGSTGVVVIFDQATQLARAFSAVTPEGTLTFDVATYSP